MLLSEGAPLWIPLGKANEIEHLARRYGTLVRGSSEENELSAKSTLGPNHRPDPTGPG
jgi:hypothetical protein